MLFLQKQLFVHPAATVKSCLLWQVLVKLLVNNVRLVHITLTMVQLKSVTVLIVLKVINALIKAWLNRYRLFLHVTKDTTVLLQLFQKIRLSALLVLIVQPYLLLTQIAQSELITITLNQLQVLPA